jgi:hypothetical protein
VHKLTPLHGPANFFLITRILLLGYVGRNKQVGRSGARNIEMERRARITAHRLTSTQGNTEMESANQLLKI